MKGVIPRKRPRSTFPRDDIYAIIRFYSVEELTTNAAARSRVFDAVLALVEQTRKSILSDVEPETGLSPLHVAVSCKYEPLIELLVQQGARLDLISMRLGQTALHWFPLFGISAACVRTVFETFYVPDLAVDAHLAFLSRALGIRDNHGATALDLAVSVGDWTTARLYMSHDAHPDHACFERAIAQGRKGTLLWTSMLSLVSKSRRVRGPPPPPPEGRTSGAGVPSLRV